MFTTPGIVEDGKYIVLTLTKWRVDRTKTLTSKLRRFLSATSSMVKFYPPKLQGFNELVTVENYCGYSVPEDPLLKIHIESYIFEGMY